MSRVVPVLAWLYAEPVGLLLVLGVIFLLWAIGCSLIDGHFDRRFDARLGRDTQPLPHVPRHAYRPPPNPVDAYLAERLAQIEADLDKGAT